MFTTPLQHPASFRRPDTISEPLYVITPLFNPIRFRKRWKLYKDFQDYVTYTGEARLITIECSFGERKEVFTEVVNEKHTIIHVRTDEEIWIKENLINLAIQRLPGDWKYVAWVDGDCRFARPDWVGETLQQLQHYKVIQMFSEAYDLNNKYEIIKTFKSFMHSYLTSDKGVPILGQNTPYDGPGHYWHPGFAWAAKREAVDHLGGLIDWGILGGGDTFMAYALIGALRERCMPRSLGKSGIQMLLEWEKRAEKYIKRNVGCMDGALLHYFHGSKGNRAYKDRGQILTDSKFDPSVHLKRSSSGLWSIEDAPIKLRDGIMKYFRQRNEDEQF